MVIFCLRPWDLCKMGGTVFHFTRWISAPDIKNMWYISQWSSLLSFSVAAAATLAGVLSFFFFSFMTVYNSETSKPQVVQRLSSCLRGCLQVVKAPQGNCSFWNIYIYISNLFTFNWRIIVFTILHWFLPFINMN